MVKASGRKLARVGRKAVAIGFFAILPPWIAVFAQPHNSSLEGDVTDTQGAAIAHAHILLHWDPSGSKVGLSTNVGIEHDIEIETDKDGKFRADLPAGFYDVFTAAEAFSPHAEKVRLKPDSRVQVHARLPVDPLVVKELGDSVFAK
jgi:hypothetical protein